MTLRTDTHFPTGADGLTNARTRIVGTSTGFFADALVALVRLARSASRFLASVFGRIAAVVTPLGWSIVAIIPLGFLVGYAVNWPELVVVAYAGIVMLSIAILYLVGRSSLTLELRIPHNRVVVGDSAIGEVVAGNPGRFRAAGVLAEVSIGAGLAELPLQGIPPQGHFAHEFGIPAIRRGVVTVGPVRTVRADPLGLVRRELVLTGATELFVHPRTMGIPGMSVGFVRDLEGSPTKDLTNSDIAFHALREYVAGDERRYIHWKSTAKTGTYMVRQFEETRRSQLVIALSLASADFASDEEFELGVSVAASLGIRAIRDTRDVAVVVSEKTPEFAKHKVFALKKLATLSRTRLLDDLAVVDRVENALAIDDLARVAGDQVSGISVAFLICGSTTSPTALRSASLKFPLGTEVVAIVCDVDAIPGFRTAAGLSVLTIGYLEDLHRSLLKATT